MFENVEQAFQGIWGHKLRSILTMLGIIIGIASIIIIVSTIKGTNEQIKEQLVGSGSNVVTVSLYQGDYTYDMQYSSLPEGVKCMTKDDRDKLLDISGVAGVSLYNQRSYADGVFVGSRSFSGNIFGADENFFSVEGYTVNYGRGFVEKDYKTAAKVAVIDDTAKTSLFPTGNPIGKTIEIQGEPFTVIGVASKSSAFEPTINSISDYYTYKGNSSGAVFITNSAWPIVYRFDEPSTVALKATNTDAMTDIGKSAADYLTANLITGSNSDFKYKSEDLLEQAKQLQELSTSTNKQLIWIASISLLVGGIGVMNIMLVSVTERTSEIGLKKAIGAKRKRILWQFLTEASVLTSLGGIIGVAAGIAMAMLISKVMETPSAISVPAILIAVVFSMVIGVVFGLVPAVKASKLNPIEALRRE